MIISLDSRIVRIWLSLLMFQMMEQISMGVFQVIGWRSMIHVRHKLWNISFVTFSNYFNPNFGIFRILELWTLNSKEKLLWEHFIELGAIQRFLRDFRTTSTSSIGIFLGKRAWKQASRPFHLKSDEKDVLEIPFPTFNCA